MIRVQPNRLIVEFMRMAVHAEGRLVNPNDLHHVQVIERRRERDALVRFVGVLDEAVIVHLRAGGLHGAQIGAI
jgi:hypothetical protein